MTLDYLGIYGLDSSLAECFGILDKYEYSQISKEEAKKRVDARIDFYKATLLNDFEAHFTYFKQYIEKFKDQIGEDACKQIQKIIDEIIAKDTSKAAIKKLKGKTTSFYEMRAELEKIILKTKAKVMRIIKKGLKEQKELEAWLMKMYEMFNKKQETSAISKKVNNDLINVLIGKKTQVEELSTSKLFNLYKNFEQFDTTTIDWDASFEHCATSDGTITTAEAKKSYDLAKRFGKKVRVLGMVYHSSKPKVDLQNMTGEQLKELFGRYLDQLKQDCPEINCFDFFNELAYDEGLHKMMGDYDETFNPDDEIHLEPSFWQEKLGDDYFIDLLVMARERFSDAKFYYNDFGHENPEKAKIVFEIVDRIQKYEQEHDIHLLDGIGLQCRVNSETQNFTENMERVLESAKKRGLSVQITEADVVKITSVDGKPIEPSVAEERQISVYDEIVSLAENHMDIIEGVTFGDMCDATSFSAVSPQFETRSDDPAPTMFDEDGDIKPSFEPMVKSLQEKTTTHEEEQKAHKVENKPNNESGNNGSEGGDSNK